VVSISQGGDHSIENLITLCDICHRSVDGRHANVRKLRRASRRRRC
jgi:5-methylcytosine-specific restriction endonuclease McrA